MWSESVGDVNLLYKKCHCKIRMYVPVTVEFTFFFNLMAGIMIIIDLCDQ